MRILVIALLVLFMACPVMAKDKQKSKKEKDSAMLLNYQQEIEDLEAKRAKIDAKIADIQYSINMVQ